MRHNTERLKKIAAAMRRAKKAFGNECIITGAERIDGAHIYPRSTYPELAACEFNIVPLSRQCHEQMDRRQTGEEKISFLISLCRPENWPMLIDRLDKLAKTREQP